MNFVTSSMTLSTSGKTDNYTAFLLYRFEDSNTDFEEVTIGYHLSAEGQSSSAKKNGVKEKIVF